MNPTHQTIEDVEEISGQLYAILQTLCEKEAFQVVRSAGKSQGLEAWRKLNRRFDPSTGGRRGAMLRAILSPQKCTKLDHLWAAVETWEENVRQYEQRRRSDGTRQQLDSEIKVSILEQLCPVEIERHLQLNRSRYSDYADVRAELVMFLETRLGHRLKLGDASGAHSASGGDPMDVGSFSKGGKKGKGKKGKGDGKKGSPKGKSGKGSGQTDNKGKGSGSGSKETRVCHNCNKIGHLKKDCWAAGGGAANKNQQPKAKAKSGGKSKGVGNLEEEPQAEPLETGFLSIAMLEEWSEDDVKMEEDAGPSSSSTFVTVRPEGDKYVMFKSEDSTCAEPCDVCFHFRCQKNSNEKHHDHECGVCGLERERLVEESSKDKPEKKSVRDHLKILKPEKFHYVLDKTICLFKGITIDHFNGLSEDEKKELRDKHDPLSLSRESNAESLKLVEHHRNDLRIGFLERVSKSLMEGANRTFGLRSAPEAEEPSRSSGSAELPTPSRPIGTSSTQAMHRTVELLEVSNLDAEKREKIQELEECDDEDEYKQIEKRIAEIDARKNELKEKIRENDREAKEKKAQGSFKLTEATVNDQSWHDARYHAALKAGVSHSKAWFEEKKRRKATLHRRSGGKERAEEKLRLDEAWHKEFDSKKVKDEEYHDETLGGIETEAVVVEEDKIRVLSGKPKLVRRGHLKRKDAGVFVKSSRSYRKLTQDEVAKFKTETRADEQRVMSRQRVDIHKKRQRTMTESKKLARSFRVKTARARRRKAKNEDAFYLQHPKGGMMCSDFKRSFCRRGARCNMGHSEVDREIGFIKRRNDVVVKTFGKVQEINSFEGG